jgi:hypothetical protein
LVWDWLPNSLLTAATSATVIAFHKERLFVNLLSNYFRNEIISVNLWDHSLVAKVTNKILMLLFVSILPSVVTVGQLIGDSVASSL